MGLSLHLLHWAFVGAFNLELDGQPSTLENFRPLKKLSSLSCCLELKIVRWALPGTSIQFSYPSPSVVNLCVSQLDLSSSLIEYFVSSINSLIISFAKKEGMTSL